MLTTILNLNKRVLVVDAPKGELTAIGNDKEVYYAIKYEGENYTKIADGKKWKFLCKGEDLTEEIAKEIIEKDDINGFHDDFVNGWAYLNYKDDVYVYTEKFSALDSFISAIEACGHYWLENPIIIIERGEDTEHNRVKNQNDWREAESKTFKNPILFEIL